MTMGEGQAQIDSDSETDDNVQMTDEQLAILNAVFKPEVVEMLTERHVSTLARAIDVLAQLGLLTAFCSDAQNHVHEQQDGTTSFHADVTSAGINGNVQLNIAS